MSKKATLLIKNLHRIYTMENKPLSKGFIAIHHDEILDIGVHEYQTLIDKDTRIIDGENHIAVPSFIEVDAQFPHTMKSMREYDEYFMRYMLNGTCVMHLNQKVKPVFYKNYHYALLDHEIVADERILHVIKRMKQPKDSIQKGFCISCGDDEISLQNQMLAAQLLAMKEEIDAYELLKALTIYPAAYLGVDMGVLRKGALANVLILSTSNIHDFFYSLDQKQIAHIIHKGVRIFPNLLI